MAGIYIHIPFCKQACHYCNFHFSTTFEKYRKELLLAIKQEIISKSNWIPENLNTIYFGGGTPSLLTALELEEILKTVKNHYQVQDIEVTLEANPDDLNKDKLDELKQTGINRLSIGIQSFFAEDLKLMNRAHTEEQARTIIPEVLKAGFHNYSIDFIYAQPLLTMKKWIQNLSVAIEYKVPHISAYNLTVKEQTTLKKFVQNGSIDPISEQKGIEQFIVADELLEEAGYNHYEISNYALPGKESKHNSSYWYQKNYLGIGPSAHSYINGIRYANVNNNAAYIKAEGMDFEQEKLTEKDLYNEFVMTRLRLKEGVLLKELKEKFPSQSRDFHKTVEQFKHGEIEHTSTFVRLSKEGKLMADAISADFFIV